MSKVCLRVSEIDKSLSKRKILDNVTFSVLENNIFGILGRNGAGKTVLMNILNGLIKPDAGGVFFLGENIEKKYDWYRKQINFASGYQSLQIHASIRENLKTFGGLYDVKDLNNEITKITDILEISKKILDKKVFGLSSGETSKAVLAKALLTKPKLLFLDEPTAFLDPVFKIKLNKIFKDINKTLGATIIITSHQLDEITDLCNEVLIIKEGKVSYCGNVKSQDKLLNYF